MNEQIEYEYYQLTLTDVVDWLINAVAIIKLTWICANRRIDQIVATRLTK